MKILFSRQVFFSQELKKVKMKGYGIQSSISIIECQNIWSAFVAADRYLEENPNGLVDLDVVMENQTITVEGIKKGYTVVLTF